MEGISAPVILNGNATADQIKIAILTTIEQILIKTALQQISAHTALQGVPSPTAIQQIVCRSSLEQIIPTVAQQLVPFVIANQHFAGIGANRETDGIEEVVHPRRHVTEALVAISVFVDKDFAFNLKTNMEHAVSDGVDQIAAEKLGAATIVLDFVEPGFSAISFIIAMILHKLGIAVGANPATDQPQVVLGDPAIAIHPRSSDGIHIKVQQAVCGG